MERDVNKEMLQHCLEYAKAMETRILSGEVIADVIYEVDKARIIVTRTETGRYGYAVIEEGKDVEAVKQLLGHEDQSTTLNFYIVKPDSDDVGELF